MTRTHLVGRPAVLQSIAPLHQRQSRVDCALYITVLTSGPEAGVACCGVGASADTHVCFSHVQSSICSSPLHTHTDTHTTSTTHIDTTRVAVPFVATVGHGNALTLATRTARRRRYTAVRFRWCTRPLTRLTLSLNTFDGRLVCVGVALALGRDFVRLRTLQRTSVQVVCGDSGADKHTVSIQ